MEFEQNCKRFKILISILERALEYCIKTCVLKHLRNVGSFLVLQASQSLGTTQEENIEFEAKQNPAMQRNLNCKNAIHPVTQSLNVCIHKINNHKYKTIIII
jgi:hypothetical protein